MHLTMIPVDANPTARFLLLILTVLFLDAATSFVFPSSNLACCREALPSITKLHMEALMDRGDNEEDDDDDDEKKKNQQMPGMERSSYSDIGDDLDDDEIELILQEAMASSNAVQQYIPAVRIAEWKQQLDGTSPPPLTTMRRVRIEQEIALLRRLVHSDDASDELAQLWASERGPGAAKVLAVADALVRRKGDSSSAQQAEALLIHVIEQEGLQFVAPLLLLAWRYGMSGKVEESKDLYQMVLQQKPWHMGALVGHRNACEHLNDSAGMAAYECLPSLDRPDERERWVATMVAIAQTALGNAEQGLQSYFDTTCDGEDLDGCIVFDDNFGEDAWQ